MYRWFPKDILESLHSIPFDNDLLDVIGLTNTTDTLCLADLLDVEISSVQAMVKVIYVKHTRSANMKQSYMEYERKIKAYNKKAKEKEKMFLLKIDNSAIEPISEDSVTILEFTKSSKNFCINNIAMAKHQFCQGILFHKDEFIIHDNGYVTIENNTFRPGEFVLRQTPNGTVKYVQMCLNDFISSHKINNRNKHVSSSTERQSRYSINIILFLLSVVNELNQLK